MITTLNVAMKFNRSHRNMLNLINIHMNLFKELGEMKKIKEKTLGRPCVFYALNLEQLKFLITLMQGNNIVPFKALIVKDTFDINLFKGMEMPSYTTYLYIIKNLAGLYKLGMSKRPKDRINTISRHLGQELKTIYISDELVNGHVVESKIEDLYADKKSVGEWFKFNKKDIESIKLKIIEFMAEEV